MIKNAFCELIYALSYILFNFHILLEIISCCMWDIYQHAVSLQGVTQCTSMALWPSVRHRYTNSVHFQLAIKMTSSSAMHVYVVAPHKQWIGCDGYHGIQVLYYGFIATLHTNWLHGIADKRQWLWEISFVLEANCISNLIGSWPSYYYYQQIHV